MSDDEAKNIWGSSRTRVGFDLSANRFQDDEAYRSGGLAWVSQVRRSSHARTDGAAFQPTDHAFRQQHTPEPRRASLGAVNGPLMLGSLYKNLGQQPLNHFTGPSISLLDQFSNLADATRAAELRNSMGDLSIDPKPKPPVAVDAPVFSPRTSPLFTRRAVSHQSTLPARSTAPPAGTGPVPEAVSVPGAIPATTRQLATMHTLSHNSSPAADPLRTPSPPQQSQQPQFRGKRWKKKRFDSPLLEILRTKSKSVDVSDILGHVLEVSTDQYGSRFIQERLTQASPEVRQMFFQEASANSLSLMTDVFGNYVIQQLFELGTPSQRAAMVTQMQGHVVALSLQMYGCRVVQMAVKYSPETQQIRIMNELEGNVIRCIKDHNGNHVIQKSIECLPPRHVKFIYNDLMTQTIELAHHTYGCRVVQRILEYADEDTKRQLLAELRPNIRLLTENQYGNYIIQHIVDNGPDDERALVFETLLPSAIELSSHKYASNVIEKCFIKGTRDQRSRLIDEILSGDKDNPAIIAMIKDQYANYVVQKIIDTSKGEEYTRLVSSIKPHLATLKRNSYGKHLASIERLLNVC